MGINLNYESKVKDNDFYQIDKWELAGTPPYMDPIIRDCLRDRVDEGKFDLFKADVYSLGLSLYYAATGIHVKNMNTK